MSQENLGRADKTIDLLNNDKDRLQKQVSAVSREFEKRVAALEDELEAEQNKVVSRTESGIKILENILLFWRICTYHLLVVFNRPFISGAQQAGGEH